MVGISFIVPVYKVEKYLDQCVQSILNQTFKDFELILVDDGSPDSCPQICDNYAKHDSRVKVIHKENGGVDEARNTGIEAASGEYAYFVDSDDWIELDAAQRLYRYAKRTGADCVMTDCLICYENGKTDRQYQFSKTFFTVDKNEIMNIQKFVLCHKFSPHYSKKCGSGYAAPWGKFVKLSILKDNNIRFNPYSKGVFDDGIYSLYLLDNVKSFFYRRDKKHTYNYRIVGTSLTHGYKEDAIDILKRGAELIDDFASKTGKGEDFMQAEYCRRVSFFSGYLSRHFYSDQNTKSYDVVREEIKCTAKRYPFAIAIKKAKYRNLTLKHKYTLFCVKHGFYAGLKFYAKLRLLIKR